MNSIKWAPALALACWASSAQATPITFETANPFITFTSVGTDIAIAISPLITAADYGGVPGLLTLAGLDMLATPRSPPEPGECGHGVICDTRNVYNVNGDQSFTFSSGANRLNGVILWTILDARLMTAPEPKLTGSLISAIATGDASFVGDLRVGAWTNFLPSSGELSSSNIPIPAALPLFLSALAGLGLFARRRNY